MNRRLYTAIMLRSNRFVEEGFKALPFAWIPIRIGRQTLVLPASIRRPARP